jgi:tight adherence protein B
VDISLVILAAFAGLTLVMAAVLLLVKDLVWNPASDPNAHRQLIRRMPLARDDIPAHGMTGRIDYSFGRLVTDSGLECTPNTACLLLIFCGLLLAGALFLWNEEPLPAVAGMLAGMSVPLLIWMVWRAKRLRTLQTQLPDALDLLSRAVHAGESLDQAVDLVGQKSAEPLATEFRRISRQLAMGLSLPAAMRALAYRLQMMDVRILSTTLAVHRQTGGNLASTLERMAAVVRERLTYKRQIRATTAAGRFSAMLITAAGPFLFIYMFFFRSDYIGRLLSQPLGQMLLAAAIILEIIGIVWVLTMLRSSEY